MPPRNPRFGNGRIRLLIVVSAICLAATCPCHAAGDSSTTTPPPTVEASRPTILFDMTMVNWATGFTCRGMCIDTRGNVYAYNCTELGDRLRKAGSDADRAIIWKTRFGCRDTIVMHLDSLELNSYCRLVPKAALERVGPRKQSSADMGSTSFHAYWPAAPDSTGQDILLGTFGDWTTEREGESSRKLVFWLKQIAAQMTDVIFRK